MEEVRLGIAGMGGMGLNQARKILAGDIRGLKLAAVCDLRAEALQAFPDAAHFHSSGDMIHSGDIDAVLIVTPHFDHTSVGIEALEGGLHVLVEKPVSVHKADCERLFAAHRDERQIFAAMLNQRTQNPHRWLYELIHGGELGEICRVVWTITNWFRTETYYRSGGWRATWAGEGGGVLLNQCLHQLDLWQWLFGMPKQLTAHCALGRFHDIEVEDDVTAFLEYENGCTGIFIASTGESPGSNRLEISGENGRVVLENKSLSYTRNLVPMSQFGRDSGDVFARPPSEVIEVDLPPSENQHRIILQNFANAILHGAELIAPAEEGIHSIELANAMIYSSIEKRPVEFPLNAETYESFLNRLIQESEHSPPSDE